MLSLTKLSYSSLYPTYFESQKFSLTANVFNEKTVTATDIRLSRHECVCSGSYNILNVQTPYDGARLNDADQHPVNDVNDERIDVL